jgi:hypothetical protein
MAASFLAPRAPLVPVTDFSASTWNIMSVQSDGPPAMLRLLPVEERGQYQHLVESIASDVDQAKKHSSLTEFIKHITLVHGFIARGNLNDPLRGIVCGVEFGRGFILVNTDRLKKVLFRSKSCMNGCWQRLGYDVMRPSHDIVCLFTRLLPNVNPEFFAIKQWCIRLVSEESRICFVSNLPDTMTHAFEIQRIPNQKVLLQPHKTIADVVREDVENFSLWDVHSLLNRKPVMFSEMSVLE